MDIVQAKIKKTFRIKVVVKGASKEFKEGMGVGILIWQDLEFTLTETEFASSAFKSSLYDYQRNLMLDTITTTHEEIMS